MKFLLVFACLLAGSAASLYAQMPQGGMGGRSFNYDDMPAIGTVSGSVADAADGKPLAKASVSLIRLGRDSASTGVVVGTVSTLKGLFRIEGVKAWRYVLRVSYIGYTRFISDTFFILPQAPEKNFGTIKMSSAPVQTSGVTVTAERDLIENDFDKRVFNVDRTLLGKTGNANEVLNNIPSVNVDIEGKVSMRGSENVTIQIDGKPVSDRNVLQQLPASAIDKVELVTNPNARYDAEGTAGIINVVLKRDTKLNVNGSLTAGAGTGDKYNASLNVNYRNQSYGAFAGYSFFSDHRTVTGDNERKNMLSSGTYYLNQYNDGANKSPSHLLRGGLDLFLSPASTLGIGGSYGINANVQTEQVQNNYLDATQTLTQLWYRFTDGRNDGRNGDVNLSYKLTLAPKQELSASAFYNFTHNVNDAAYSSRNYTLPGRTPSGENPSLQNVITDNTFKSLIGQADYTHPLGKDAKFETGLKVTARDIDNDYNATRFDYPRSVFVRDTLLSNRFRYKDQVYAAYALYSGTLFEGFQYQLGLRAEQTATDFSLVNGNTSYKRDYFGLFPSVLLKQSLPDNNDLKISYSRRITRPNINALNPFTNYTDTLNLFSGNPYLNPEFIDSYEFTYDKNWEKHGLSATAYYRRVSDKIERFRTVDTLGIARVTFINYDKNESYGVEMLGRTQPVPWCDIILSANLYKIDVNEQTASTSLGSSSAAGFGRLMLNLRPWDDGSIQVTGMYMAPIKYPQVMIDPMYGLDLAIRQDFLDNMFSASLTLSDALNTRKFSISQTAENFEVHNLRKRESRVLNLTLTYRFGKPDKQQRRQPRPNEGAPGDQGGGLDF